MTTIQQRNFKHYDTSYSKLQWQTTSSIIGHYPVTVIIRSVIATFAFQCLEAIDKMHTTVEQHLSKVLLSTRHVWLVFVKSVNPCSSSTVARTCNKTRGCYVMNVTVYYWILVKNVIKPIREPSLFRHVTVSFALVLPHTLLFLQEAALTVTRLHWQRLRCTGRDSAALAAGPLKGKGREDSWETRLTD